VSLLERIDRWMWHREVRADWGTTGTTAPPRTRYVSLSGAAVDMSSTLGLATAGAAVKLVSETVGLAPLKIYQGEKPDVTEARDSWQWFRLKEQPNDDQSAFDFWTDAASSIETEGDAFIWKSFSRRPVRGAEEIELYLLDPGRVQVKRDENGKRYYEVWRNGQREKVPASQILHIRGWTSVPGGDRGLSTVAQYRETLGTALAGQEYASEFYANGMSIPGWVTVPGVPDQESQDRLQEITQQRHGGPGNRHKIGILSNGAGWVPSGISQKDAQFIETMSFSAEEMCRVFRVWPPMLGVNMTASKGGDDDRDRFLTVDMAPRYRRIEMAVGRDPDLFPAGSELFPEFLTAAILKPSILARNAAYKDALQAGWQVANEVRELENYPPLEGGDTLQQTPVGGAPNPSQPEPVDQEG